MSHEDGRPLVRLLRAATGDDAAGAFEDMSAETALWAVEAGLGPFLRQLTPDASRLTRSSVWPAVMGSDLTARMRSETLLRALEEVVAVCETRLPPLTLLKGISLCIEQYPAPYLRTMGDIDLLVEPDWIDEAERLIRQLGYRSAGSPAAYRDHHHIAPLVHPDSEVWIELHRGLFPPRSALGGDGVFSAASVRAERRPGLVRGRRVHHLSPELQLVYLSAHWAQDPELLTRPHTIRSMLDTMLILRNASTLRWPTVLAWLDGAAAATPVYLMLAYLEGRGLVTLDRAILDEVRRRQHALGPAGLRLAFALLDRYVFDSPPAGMRLGARTLALLWTGLLEDGAAWRKTRAVSSRLVDGVGRRWSRFRGREEIR